MWEHESPLAGMTRICQKTVFIAPNPHN